MFVKAIFLKNVFWRDVCMMRMSTAQAVECKAECTPPPPSPAECRCVCMMMSQLKLWNAKQSAHHHHHHQQSAGVCVHDDVTAQAVECKAECTPPPPSPAEFRCVCMMMMITAQAVECKAECTPPSPSCTVVGPRPP